MGSTVGASPGAVKANNGSSLSTERQSRRELSAPVDSLSGTWDLQISVTNIRTPSDTCSIGGMIVIAEGPSQTGVDRGRIDLRRVCSQEGRARELSFDGPISIESTGSDAAADAEVWIVTPECRLRLDRVTIVEDGPIASGFATCALQAMREPQILEGSWEMVRRGVRSVFHVKH